MNLSRRAILAAFTSAAALSACGSRAQAREMVVYKSPTCGCCSEWVEHMRQAGFRATVVETDDLEPVRLRHGVADELAGCHTAVIEGYVVEGHVPADDVLRMLAERPNGLGLSVPGMPMGSPGMEVADGAVQPYETLLLLDRTGRTEVFASHA
jgi:hypothetical protein